MNLQIISENINCPLVWELEAVEEYDPEDDQDMEFLMDHLKKALRIARKTESEET